MTSIADRTFLGCSGLTSIVVEDGNTKYDSRDGCNAIIETATNTLISGCQNTVIPSNVTNIGDYAFYGCSGLTSIEIPNSVTIIGESAFSRCSGLTSIEIPNSVTSIGSSSFYLCSGLKSINIPDGVTSIEASSFQSCSSLTSIEIPNSVTSIGIRAFEYCISLTSIIIPNSVTSIGNQAFYGCTGLTSIEIPNSVTSIEDKAFYNCTGLTSVTIECNTFVSDTHTSSTSCSTIFGNQVTNYTIGNKVTSIGDFTFYGCSGMTSITFGDGVTSIGFDAFRGCSGLTSITIGNSVTSIGSGAFEACSGLTSVTIGNGVTSIGSGAFGSCNHLSSITIGRGVTSIGNNAFNNCFNLTKVIVSDIATWCGISFGNSNANPLSYAKHLYSNTDTEITNLVIPNAVTNIGDYVFYGCSGLTSVTIDNSVTGIGSSAFYGCSGIASVTIGNGVTNIGNSAFSGCSGMTSVTIGNSVTSIGESAFYKCSSLTSIDIPNGVTSIEKKTFQSCRNLTSITIPNSVTDIDNYAFHGCSPTSVTIPNSVVTIGSHAFEYCGGMKSLTIGSSVTSIGDYAVSGIASLSDVYCYADNVPTSNTNIFYNTSCSNLHVPASSMEVYMGTKPWSEFKKIVSLPIPKFTLTYYVDGEEYKSYKIEKGASITPETEPTKEGYTFSGWSEIPKTMPAHDITVTGTFTINKYKLTYIVDGEVYKSFDVEYGASITPEEEPTKEYYTFSGWNELPKIMPAHDVNVTGTFTINKYKLTYTVDGELYKSFDVEYGASITSEEEPVKEGYTFNGWSEIPETMPAHDVTVTGTFSINKYKLTYIVDGELYKSYDVEYGASITPEEDPEKEGYTFSGWSEIPETMPANDVTITGAFTVNSYKVTFMYGENVLTIEEVNYGDTIPLPESLNSDQYTLLEWLDVPETMPAHDIIIYASFTDGINCIIVTNSMPVIYDLLGRRAQNVVKGNIYIFNGKKVVVK